MIRGKWVLAGALALGASGVTWAEESLATKVPPARPQTQVAVVEPDAAPVAESKAPVAQGPVLPGKPVQDPNRGAVTNLPLPRYVTLKTGEGNARRGPGLTHRIDWVFTRAGMPLKITAEYENWRRVEDAEGAGGWVHYSLLSGVRSVMITVDSADLHDSPDATSGIVLRAERGVLGRIVECAPDWCRINIQGEKGWVPKSALWGVNAGEVMD